MKKQALVLFAHGARDPNWATPFKRLQQMTQAALPDVSVSLAFLECMKPSLPDVLPTLVEAGCELITVVPVFFGQGGHVARDLPMLLESLQQAHPDLTLRTVGAVGEDAHVLSAISQYCIASLVM